MKTLLIISALFLMGQMIRCSATDRKAVEFNQCIEAKGGATDKNCEECNKLIYNN